MKSNHYLKVSFSLTKDKTPEIYDFLLDYLPKILVKLGAKAVDLKIERLEPLNETYTNLDKPEKEIKEILDQFAKSHHLEEEASMAFTGKKTSLHAKVKAQNLGQLFADYNILFDLFFTDIILKSDKLTVDMMDGFSDSLLLIGEKDELEKAKKLIEKMAKEKTVFEFVDRREKP